MFSAKARKKSKPQRNRGIVFLFILAIVLILTAMVNFITDWMWFIEMDYVDVFFKALVTQIKIGIPVFVITALLLDLYLRRIRKGYFKHIESDEQTDMKKLGRYTNIFAVIFAIFVAYYAASTMWFKTLEFINSTNFGIKDPLFGFEVSFYIFKLDFLKLLNEFAISVIILIIVMTVLYYIMLLAMHSPNIIDDDTADFTYDEEFINDSNNPFGKIFNTINARKPRKPKRKLDDENIRQLLAIASHQLTIVGIIFFLMLGVDFFLKQFGLLHAHTGAVYGAGFTDVTVTLWVYRVLTILSVLAALITPIFIRKKELKKIAIIPVIMVIVGVLGIGLSTVIQGLIVSPDELNKEKKYLARNIEYTQYAYQLDNVDVKKYAAEQNLKSKDITENKPTISNIRINDYSPVKTFYNQTQSIRQYYTFNDVDVDRYNINGNLTQSYLSVREIDENKISETWLNRHIKYTHGYGLTLSKVNTVTSSGQPDVLIKNIPPQSSVKEIDIKEPRIYFGELTNDYSLINTSEDEFDYPNGSSNKYTRYKGKAGIKLNPFARFMFAIREGSLKLLVSTNIKSDSRILIYRNVEDRVKKIMPYLKYEDDPYAVTANGRIYWIIDAYTTSNSYPYSQPYSGVQGTDNYIRNSVKVVVDAYNGDAKYYVIDKKDPIAKTYQKIYPNLFKNYEKMPESLKSHVRYPNSLFKIQGDIYARYHMNDVKVFYQNEDQWDIAKEVYGTKERSMKPNYYIVNLPGEKDAEFISSLPYTPKGKENMTALMIARNDGEKYGKLVLYQFPKSKTIYGPMQVEAQIDQDSKISQDFSLWSSSGSKYSRGNLFIVPIKDSLMYVEPVYLEASNAAIPEVKRVIVVYGDTIAYESTLGDALTKLFGANGGADKSENTVGGNASSNNNQNSKKTKGDYIKQAQKAYDKAQDALKKGDWTAYGKYMDELSEALKKLD